MRRREDGWVARQGGGRGAWLPQEELTRAKVNARRLGEGAQNARPQAPCSHRPERPPRGTEGCSSVDPLPGQVSSLPLLPRYGAGYRMALPGSGAQHLHSAWEALGSTLSTT